MSASKILNPGRRVVRSRAALNAAGDRHVLAGLQRRDRLQVAAVFVAEGKSVEEIFDGDEPDPLQIGGSLRSDAFQILERGLKVVRHGRFRVLVLERCEVQAPSGPRFAPRTLNLTAVY